MRKIFFVSILFISFCLQAQVEITTTTSNPDVIGDLYNFQVNNMQASMDRVRFEVILKQNNITLYQAFTRDIMLISGTSSVNLGMLQPIQVDVNKLNSDIITGQGTDLMILMYNSQNELIYKHRVNINTDVQSGKKEGSVSQKIFESHGRVFINSQISDVQGFGSSVPENYIRADISPDLTVKGIPIGLDVLWSTEHSNQRQSLNQVAFRFDAQAFKQAMAKQIRAKVGNIEDFARDPSKLEVIESQKQAFLNKKFPSFAEAKTMLSDTALSKKMASLQEYEKLSQILNNDEIKNNTSRFQALTNKKKVLTEIEKTELQYLMNFNTEIQQLRDKAKALEKIKGEASNIKKYQQQFGEGKRFLKNGIYNDPAFLKSLGGKLGFMSKWQSMLEGLDQFSLGTSFPYLSKLTLNSLSVNGAAIEVSPGKLYLYACYGSSSREVLDTSFTLPILTPKQNTFAIKAGIGNQHDNHFHISIIDIKDQEGSDSMFSILALKQNRLIATDLQYSLFKGKIILSGEISGSLLTNDTRMAPTTDAEYRTNDLPLKFLLPTNMNNSSIFDVAYRVNVNSKLFNGNTQLSGNVERIGPNYFSLGAPMLIRDLLRWRGDLRQSFLKRKINVSLFAARDVNQLNPLLSSIRSETFNVGATANINIPKAPSIIVTYAPYTQNAALANGNNQYNSKNKTLNVTAQYPLTILNQLTIFTQINYLNQTMESNIPGIGNTVKIYGINESVQYKDYSVNISYSQNPITLENAPEQKVKVLDLSGAFTIFKKVNNRLGYQQLDNGIDKRTGFYLNSQINIVKGMSLDLKIYNNIYRLHEQINDSNEKYALIGLRYEW